MFEDFCVAIRGIGARKPPLGFKIRQILTSKNTTKNKIWGPNFSMASENFPAAFGGRKNFELFDQKMLISKGKMVKTATFFWPPSAAGIFLSF